MTFKYKGWTLYSTSVKMKNGPLVTIYFFEKGKPNLGKRVDALPPGRLVAIDKKTGLPYLEKTYRGYQLTKPEYLAHVRRQKGRCSICGEKPRGGSLVIDHVHATGTFRGLVCGLCNSGLGMFRDSPKLLRAAARYLTERS